jgi:ribosome-binding ATPase YchF (GTP1/OBG family)
MKKSLTRILTSKLTLFACNVAESDLPALVAGVADPGDGAQQHVRAVEDYARNHFATEAVVISAQIESELVDLSEAEAAEYLRDLGVEGSGVGAIAPSHPLGLRTYLTTGERNAA